MKNILHFYIFLCIQNGAEANLNISEKPKVLLDKKYIQMTVYSFICSDYMIIDLIIYLLWSLKIK